MKHYKLQCAQCGKIFYIDSNNSKRRLAYKHNFCNNKCCIIYQLKIGQLKKSDHSGWHHTEEAKKRIGEAEKGNKYGFQKGHSVWNKGKKGIMQGKNHPMYGKHHSIKSRKKMREAQKGEKHWNWKGEYLLRDYSFNFNKELKELIRKRDNYKCQLCGVPQEECLTKLHVHHIDYNKKNSNPNNLTSLCNSCHQKTNLKREYYQKIFPHKVEVQN